MNAFEVHKGNQLAPGESVVWQGVPTFRDIAYDVFHLRAASAYFMFLFALDAEQAWAKDTPFAQAVHDSVPLVVLCGFAFGVLALAALRSAKTTRYTITSRRVILHYGLAFPATLSLPYARITKVSMAIGRRHAGNIVLSLTSDDHIGYLKLWPFTRPWRLAHPEPMLRAVPRAAVAAGLLTRAIHDGLQARANGVNPNQAGAMAPALGSELVPHPFSDASRLTPAV